MIGTVNPKPETVWSRDGKVAGKATGSQHPCQMEGCRGQRVSVKWPDGSRTFPCSRGMVPVGMTAGSWQII